MVYKLKIFVFVFVAISSLAQTEEAMWTPETIMKVKTIGHVDVSPNGKEVLYTVTEKHIKQNTSETQIWKTNVDEPESSVRFTTDKKSSTYPRWSPDGEWIAFLSKRSGVNNLFLIRANGGEAVQITDTKDGVETFRWSPDGSMIAFVAKKTEKSSPNKNLVLEVEKYTKPKTSHLFLVKAKPELQTPETLTTGDYYVIGGIDFGMALEAFDWSFDNQKIAFTYTPEDGQDSRWKDSQIAIVDINSKRIEALQKQAPHQSIPKFSPDGKYLAFLKSDENSSYCLTKHVTLYSFADGLFKELQKTPDEAPFLVGPSILGWSPDGSSILYLEPFRTKFAIWSIPANGDNITRLDNHNWTFNNPLLSHNGKWLGISLQTMDKPVEAFVTSSSVFSPKQISHVNEQLGARAQTEIIHWNSYDGTEIEGLLTYPKGYIPGNRYPFLLAIHGGPMGVFLESYSAEYGPYPLAAFADQGFVILRANPRGSCGYGRNFRYGTCSNWGGSDYQDLMSGVDALIDQGIIDQSRMGVMGWSYGGYMTAWIIGQTDRFAAASMGAGISNLLSMNYTTDIHHYVSDYMEGEFFEKSDLYLQRSPIYYTHNIKTPLLIQHGENDERVPFSQGLEFYNALRKENKPVVMIAYPRTTHHMSEPKLELDALQRNLDWFIEKVKNKENKG